MNNVNFVEKTYSCASGVDLVFILTKNDISVNNIYNFFFLLKDDLSLYETNKTNNQALHKVSDYHQITFNVQFYKYSISLKL